MLTFKEELFLLLHWSSGKDAIVELHPGTSDLIAAGGILAEGLLAGRLRLDERSLVVTDAGATGDEILDEALAKLAPAQSRDPSNPEWLTPIAQKLPPGYTVFDRLFNRGMLHEEEKRSMFGLSRSTIYVIDAGVAQQLNEREMNVMVRGAKPDPHTAALLFMAGSWGREPAVKLSGKEKKAYRKRYEALFGDYWGAYPAGHEIEPIEGLDPATRKAIGELAISWASIQATYVVADYAEWRRRMEHLTN